jgi:AraC-like DNA-binding protein
MTGMRTGRLTVSAYLTRSLLGHAAKQGIDSQGICRHAGLPADALDDLEARIPARVFESIWNEVVRRSQDGSFGLHLGAGGELFKDGYVLRTVMLNCPTLGDGIDRFCRYHGLLADFVNPKLDCEGERAKIVLQPVRAEVALDRHHAEAVLAAIASLLRSLVEGGVSLVQVWFGHPQPGAADELQRFFGCPLRFRAPLNALVFAREDLARPLAMADPELLATLEELVQTRLARLQATGRWAAKVRAWFGRALPRGEKPSIASVARELGVSGRLLQSRLKQEGTSYQKLLDQVREDLAIGYLKKGDVTLCELAFLLGYSEQSAFNHAFKRWTGSTPGEFKVDALLHSRR